MNVFDNAAVSYSYLVGSISATLVIGTIYFFYLKNLYDLLKLIKEENRRIAPKAVWFILLNIFSAFLKIPIFYFSYEGQREIAIGIVVLTYLIAIFVIIWHFRIVRAVADSIEAEFDSRKIPIEYRPSYQTGMFMSVSGAVTLINEVPYIGIIGSLAGLAFFIGMIAYWVRTYKFKKEIKLLPEYQDEESLIFNDLN
jgi:hypothetical protein